MTHRKSIIFLLILENFIYFGAVASMYIAFIYEGLFYK